MVEIGKLTVVKTHASFQNGHSPFYPEGYGFILKRSFFPFLLWVYCKKIQNKWVVHYFNVFKKTLKKDQIYYYDSLETYYCINLVCFKSC